MYCGYLVDFPQWGKRRSEVTKKDLTTGSGSLILLNKI
jgi:hypothetical protein